MSHLSPPYSSQYTLNEKNKKNKNLKEAPLADPEPISDISAQNTNIGSPNPENDVNHHQIPKSLSQIPVVLKTYPAHLQPLLGKLATDQQVHKEKKIVLYLLAAQNGKNLNKSFSVQECNKILPFQIPQSTPLSAESTRTCGCTVPVVDSNWSCPTCTVPEQEISSYTTRKSGWTVLWRRKAVNMPYPSIALQRSLVSPARRILFPC